MRPRRNIIRMPSSEIFQYYGFDLDCPSEEQVEITNEIFDRFARIQNDNADFFPENQSGRTGNWSGPGSWACTAVFSSWESF